MHTEVDVPNSQHVLLPGMYADADLHLDRKDNIPSIPVQAVSHRGDKTTVLVISADGVLEQRAVEIGLETSSDAEIVSGLNEGEQVVVSDRSGLKAGQKVRAQTVTEPEYHEGDAQQ